MSAVVLNFTVCVEDVDLGGAEDDGYQPDRRGAVYLAARRVFVGDPSFDEEWRIVQDVTEAFADRLASVLVTGVSP